MSILLDTIRTEVADLVPRVLALMQSASDDLQHGRIDFSDPDLFAQLRSSMSAIHDQSIQT